MSNPVDTQIEAPATNDKVPPGHKEGKLKTVQHQVDEVVGIMRSNVEKIIVREEKLTDLDQRADQLNASASEFQTTSSKIKKKYWWRNMKMMFIIIALVILVILIIVASILGTQYASD